MPPQACLLIVQLILCAQVCAQNFSTTQDNDDGYRDYDGYQVLTMLPQSTYELGIINKLDEVLGLELDFFRHGALPGTRSDVIIPPDFLYSAKDFLLQNNVDFNVTIPNLRIPIERQRRALFRQRVSLNPVTFQNFNLRTYHTFDEQMRFLSLAAIANPSVTRLFTIGNSFQNRRILGITLGSKRLNKPVLFIDGGIHAREWISSATAIYLVHEFLKPQYRALLNQIDIMVVPNVNPDGYEFSRTRDRLWRKTRSGPIRGCFGTDLNRNFPFRYAFMGASTNPCSEIFRGRSMLSEVEGRNLRNVLMARRNSIKAYVTLHSFGENLLYPWGYQTRTYPTDVNDLITMGRAMSSAIQRVHGTRYEVANAADLLYPAAGASDDFAKSIGIKYVYTIELRPGDNDNDDDSRFGFELPEFFIQRTADEIVPGVSLLARRVAGWARRQH